MKINRNHPNCCTVPIKPIKTKKTPNKAAFPDPYLSAMAPNSGDPMPIKRN